MGSGRQFKCLRAPVRSYGGCLAGSISVLILSLALAGCDGELPASPAQHVADGWRDFRWGEYDRAVADFEAAVSGTDKDDPKHAQALYGLANVWDLRLPQEKKNQPRARELYERAAARAPQSDWAAWSLLALARMEHLRPVGDPVDYAAVGAACQRVIDAFPKHLAGHEAFIVQQSTRLLSLEADDTREAAARIRQFLDENPRSAFASHAYALLAACYRTLGQHEEQLQTHIKALDTIQADPLALNDLSLALWAVATTAEFDAGDFEAARHYYERLIEEEPYAVHVFPAKEALKRMQRIEDEIRAELRGDSEGGGG